MFSEKKHLHLTKCWRRHRAHATIQNEVMATERNEILRWGMGENGGCQAKETLIWSWWAMGCSFCTRSWVQKALPNSPKSVSTKAGGRQSLSSYTWSLIIIWAWVWLGWKRNVCHKESIKYLMSLVKDVMGQALKTPSCSSILWSWRAGAASAKRKWSENPAR